MQEDFLESRPSAKLASIPAIFFLVILAVKITFLDSFASLNTFTLFWRIIVLLGFAVVGYMYVSRVTTRYVLSPLEASVCEGILSKSTHAAPLNQITNFELKRPFWKRIFGLADLYIDTPGTTEVELKMSEMNLEDALRFRKFLSIKLGQQKVAEAGDETELREEREAALKSKMADL